MAVVLKLNKKLPFVFCKVNANIENCFLLSVKVYSLTKWKLREITLLKRQETSEFFNVRVVKSLLHKMNFLLQAAN